MNTLTDTPISEASQAYQLLSAALDCSGHICIVGLKKGSPAKQEFFPAGQYMAAIALAMEFNRNGLDAYFCTSTLKKKGDRTAGNAHSVKLFKVDLDIGENECNKHRNQQQAIDTLKNFCKTYSFPRPVIVSSGNGFHAYWIMDVAIEAPIAKHYAEKLKVVTETGRLKADATVTADLSRILRVPDTCNHKDKNNPKRVELLSPISVIETEAMLKVINTAYKLARGKKNIVPTPSLELGIANIPDHLKGLPPDSLTQRVCNYSPAYFSTIVHKSLQGAGCAQLRDIVGNQAEQEEPRWRAGLSIAHACADRNDAIHAMSCEHAEYSPEATEKKASLTVGPWTCSKFKENWPQHCSGCRHDGRIGSPIALGYDDEPILSLEAFEQAVVVVRAAAQRAKEGDVGAPLEKDVIAALRMVKKTDTAEYHRLRAALKSANYAISLTALDNAVQSESGSDSRRNDDMLITLVRDRCQLFHDADREPYASFVRDGHRECWPLHSQGFREWASYTCYREYGHAPTDNALMAALSTLSGQAKFEGEEKLVAVRAAKMGDDYYLDLCDDEWQAVRVTKSGWQVIQSPPVMFVRNSAMRPLPAPVSGGDINDLWRFANIAIEDQLLVLAWCIEAFRADTPYPVLELLAEQGAAKSFTQSTLRDFIDPNRGNLRAKPKTIDDLFVSARVSHVTSLENLSYLSPEFQDALCALATGSGYGGRTLYTNMDETVFEVKRPIMMNGIAVVATAQDLMDRTLLIHLPTLNVRLTEAELKQELTALKPQIFGALLSVFSQALRILPSVTIVPDELPRMADFAHMGEAVFRAMGKAEGEFLAAYAVKRKHGVTQTIDASPVATAVISFLEFCPQGFIGTIKALQQKLEMYKPRGEQWPRSSKGIADALRRAAPSLRMMGYEITYLGHFRDGHRWKLVPPPGSDAGKDLDYGHDGHHDHLDDAERDYCDHGDHLREMFNAIDVHPTRKKDD